jgi:hypothetical protein
MTPAVGIDLGTPVLCEIMIPTNTLNMSSKISFSCSMEPPQVEVYGFVHILGGKEMVKFRRLRCRVGSGDESPQWIPAVVFSSRNFSESCILQ